MEKIRIVGCIKFFENEDTIERTLNSLTFCERIVAVDGAYQGYCDHFKSKDKSIEVIEKFRDKTDIPTIIVHKDLTDFFKDEMEKRNFMFKDWFYSKNEWVLFIDSDEYVIGDTEQKEFFKFLKEKGEEELFFLTKTFQRWEFIPPLERDRLKYWKRDKKTGLGSRDFLRIFKFLPGIRMVGNHWTLMYPDITATKYFAKLAGLSPLEIMHEPEKSNNFTKKAKVEYNERERKKHEKRFVSARDVFENVFGG